MISVTKAKPFTISRLATEVGINLETVRFYEREGLLEKAPRSRNGYRQFPVDSVRRLKFIKRAQELGFSLHEIRELLDLRTSPHTTSSEIREVAEAKLADIEARIKSLESMRDSLRKLANSCPGCGPLSDCPILESLDGDEI